jgi:hypothetical protein
MCLFVLCAALVSTAAIVPAAPAAAQTCDGDCNGDRSVAIGELILGVASRSAMRPAQHPLESLAAKFHAVRTRISRLSHACFIVFHRSGL